MHRRFSLVALLVVGSPLHPAPPLREDAALLAQPYLDTHALGEDLLLFPHGSGLLVPLGEIMRLLGIGIQCRSEAGVAEGFYLSENTPFRLDLGTRQVRIGTRTYAFAEDQVRAHQHDIFVELGLLKTWLGLEASHYPRESIIVFKPVGRVPIQDAWERDAKYGRLNATSKTLLGGRQTGPPQGSQSHVEAYRPFEIPALEGSVGVAYARHARTSVQGSLLTAGDFLWMSHQASLTRDANGSFDSSRATLLREDPHGRLLGPLGARRIELGDLLTPQSLPLIGSLPQGRGLILDNHRVSYQSTFASRTFRGRLQEGWTVELYQNNGLVAFRRANPDGSYEFKDVPLRFGLNQFRLVFIGPHGQRSEENYRLDIAQDTPKQGEFYYRVGAVSPKSFGSLSAQPHQLTEISGMAEGTLGLTDWLSTTLGGATMGTEGGPRRFATAGLSAYFPFLGAQLTTGMDRDAQGSRGRAAQLSLITGYEYSSLVARAAIYRDGFRRLDGMGAQVPTGQELVREAGLEANTSAILGGIPLAVSFGLGREQYLDGRSGDRARLGVTTSLGAFNLGQSFSTIKDRESTANRRLEAMTLLSYHTQSMSFQGEATLERSQGQQRVRSWTLQGDYRTDSNLLARFGVRGLSGGLAGATAFASLSRLTGPFSFGADLNISKGGGFSIGIRAGISLHREPRTRRLVSDGASMTTLGAASIQAFQDSNNNGRRDPGEPVLDEVRFLAGNNPQPNRIRATDVTFLTHLPRGQEIDLQIDAASLPDTTLHPSHPALLVIPRPGHVHRIDYPVSLLGEITGTTRIKKPHGVEDLGGLELELVDAQGKAWKTFRTAFDGFFELQKVPLGTYLLRVTRQESDRLGLISPPSRTLTLDAKRFIAEGQDIVLGAFGTPEKKVEEKPVPPREAKPPISQDLPHPLPVPRQGLNSAVISQGLGDDRATPFAPQNPRGVPKPMAPVPPQETWTIRLLAARHASTLERTRILLGPLADQLHVASTQPGGPFRISLGRFRSRSEAEALMQRLPSPFFALGNRPRVVLATSKGDLA